MSSDLSAPAVAGRCLFCNLGCAHELEPMGALGWRPRYGGEDSDPLCPRGQMLADLLQQPSRVHRPKLRDESLPLAAAVSALASQLRVGDGELMPLTIWLDGNMAAEDILAAHGFSAGYGGGSRILLHLPPHELGAAEGLDMAGVTPVGPERWAEADAFLCLGDPLSAHPPVARHLLRRGKERSATPVVVMDAGAGYLSTASPDFFVVRPGREDPLLEWLLAASAASAGNGPSRFPPQELELDAGDQERLLGTVQRLRSARRPAVVVAPQAGDRAGWRLAVGRAARWAAERGGTVTLLAGHANGLAAARLGRRLGMTDWYGGVGTEDRDAGAVLVAGWDPSSAYPEAAWAPAVEGARFVAMATPFPPADGSWVDLLLPLALGVEAGGGYLLADGRRHHLDPLLAPPAGVLPLRELLAGLAAELGFEVPAQEEADLLTATPLPEPLPAPPTGPTAPGPGPEGNGGMLAVLGAAPAQYFDGQITGHSAWAARVQPLPEMLVGPANARTLGLATGGMARLSNERGAALVRVKVAHQQPESAGCFAEVRAGPHLSSWLLIRGADAAVRRLAGRPGDPDQAGTLLVQAEPVAAPRGIYNYNPMTAAGPGSLAEAAHGD